jgi:hypothetical protein
MRRDRNPKAEIRTLEQLIDVYEMELTDRLSAQEDERRLACGILLSASMLSQEMCDFGK